MLTTGQYRVGVSFNPSGNDAVTQIKTKAAELIDLIDGIMAPAVSSPRHYDETERCKALALSAIEDGAMWAVKAATKPYGVGE